MRAHTIVRPITRNLPIGWQVLHARIGRMARRGTSSAAGRRRIGGTVLASRSIVSSFPRSVVAVSGDSQRAALLEGLLCDTDGFDVVVVEALGRAYSSIKELMPDLIIVFMEMDDAASCRLLSMLTLDRATSSIPVLTHAVEPSALGWDRAPARLNQPLPNRDFALQMN